MKTDAAYFAKRAHDATGALYKGKPYFERHVEEVVGVVSKAGGTDEHITVAYLHDVVEDTVVTLDDIKIFFTDAVVEAVDAITKRKGESYFEYIDRVRKNDLATFVKAADLTVNLGNDPPPKLAAKYKIALEMVDG